MNTDTPSKNILQNALGEKCISIEKVLGGRPCCPLPLFAGESFLVFFPVIFFVVLYSLFFSVLSSSFC